MDRRWMYAILAFAAAILFFVSIGYKGWELEAENHQIENDLFRSSDGTMGALLLTAALIVLVAGSILVLLLVFNNSCYAIAGCALAVISAVLSIAAMSYYSDLRFNWSPFIATGATTLTITLSGILIFDLEIKKKALKEALSMDRNVLYAVFAFAAALLFFVAIGYDGWRCEGSIISKSCLGHPHNDVTGALLITAGLIILIADIFLLLPIIIYFSWGATVACVLTVISAIFAMVGTFLHVHVNHLWSPSLASVATTLTVILSSILVFDLTLLSEDKHPSKSTGPSLLAAFFIFFAIGFNGWSCQGSILSESCIRSGPNEVTGALLLTSGLVVLIAGIILILLVVLHYSWCAIVASILAVISAVLSIAGVIYYVDAHRHWSPFIATAAMTLTVALSVILIFDLVTSR
ncbi:unnamed protein product [Hydatigera taeniaeformis]|uniref:Transmembrane protein n=1 Tax=Hydatigena taeniaeformis TaxID=6205 RepID=A0A0R3WM05_HYDTA|nr:unnamed protein product [Hydatigera taeniaeformis]